MEARARRDPRFQALSAEEQEILEEITLDILTLQAINTNLQKAIAAVKGIPSEGTAKRKAPFGRAARPESPDPGKEQLEIARFARAHMSTVQAVENLVHRVDQRGP